MKTNEIENACFIEDKMDFEKIYKKFNTTKNLFIPLDIETFYYARRII